MIQFTAPVSSHGVKRTVKVFVYDTHDQMYTAADKWGKRSFNHTPEHNYDAITHSYDKRVYDRAGNEVKLNPTGIIRLVRTKLPSYIIAHEIAHATINIYVTDCVKDGDTLQDHLDPGNETFCHILSELEHNIVSRLHKLGCYDED